MQPNFVLMKLSRETDVEFVETLGQVQQISTAES